MNTFQIMSALTTPFTKNGRIDYEALGRMIDEQMAQGIDGFIVCGTTGETPTMKTYERFDILRFVIDRTHHDVELWFGCGTNNTKETLSLVKRAANYDIDGLLLVTPYYNKPSPNGLYRHFHTIAESTELNIMLYEVASRCGVAFEADTLCRLFHDCPNITALKYAGNDYALIAKLHERFPQIRLYSGEDATFYAGMDRGLSGVISVMSNVYLKEMQEYVKTRSNDLRQYLKQVAALCFLECSPSAIKYMMHREGKCENCLRLPLVPLSVKSMQVIDAFMSHDKIHQSL